MLKFMSGDSRLKPGHSYSINFGSGGGFPSGSTCSSSMRIPYYDDKETAKKSMLTAFRLCGEIDNDGGYHGDLPEDSDEEEFKMDA